MPTIERMTPFTAYRVKLSCGHTLERTKQQVAEDQLFIGKQVACEECAANELHSQIEAGYNKLATGWIGNKR